MNTPLPAALQPAPADIARDQQLARDAQAILDKVRKGGGPGVKTTTDGYNSSTFGADGTVVARVINGVSQMTDAQEAVARAQSAANSDIQRLEAEIAKAIAQRDEISGYAPDGSPIYVRAQPARDTLDRHIDHLSLTKVNQLRFNERRWREDAAPAVRRSNSARDLALELEAKGRIQRTSGW